MISLVLLIVVLLVGSGFFSGAETALVSANRARLEGWAAEGQRDARRALLLVRRLERTLATVLVGTNLCNISASALCTALLLRYSPEHGAAWATVILTPVALFAAEILPKAFFRSRPTRILRTVSGALRVADVVLAPVRVVAFGAGSLLLRILGVPAAERRAVFQREDVAHVLAYGSVRDESPRDDGGRQRALRMASRALALKSRRIAQAVRSWDSERAILETASVREAHERFRAVGGLVLTAVDGAGTITGFVDAKALLGEAEEQSLARYVRPAVRVRPEDFLGDVLRRFRRERHTVGLVRDREGRAHGIVTLEDLFGEIVGELPQH